MAHADKKKAAAHAAYHVSPRYAWMLKLIDAVGFRLRSGKSRLDRALDRKNVKTIAVIRFDHIGDVLLSTPVFRALRSRFPNARITALVRPLTAQLLEHNPFVDEVIALSPPWFSRGKKDGDSRNSARAFRAFVRDHRDHYDVVIELHADPRNIVFGRRIGKHLVGYGIRGFGFLLDTLSPYSPQKKHIILRHLDVVRPLGIAAPKAIQKGLPPLNLPVDPRAVRALHARYPFTKAPYLVIHPGTGRVVKEWEPAKWDSLVFMLLRSMPDFAIIISGSASEQGMCGRIRDSVSSNARARVHVLAGKIDLKQLAALIKGARIIIGPDTGPIHMAYALGTPSVALFGPEDPEVWGYQDRAHRSIPDMERVSPSRVAAAAKAVMKSAR